MKIVTGRQIVLATTSLHNSLPRGKKVNSDVEVSVDTEDVTNGEVVDRNQHSADRHGELQHLRGFGGRVQTNAKELRIRLASYFMNGGAVEWQWPMTGVVKKQVKQKSYIVFC